MLAIVSPEVYGIFKTLSLSLYVSTSNHSPSLWTISYTERTWGLPKIVCVCFFRGKIEWCVKAIKQETVDPLFGERYPKLSLVGYANDPN